MKYLIICNYSSGLLSFRGMLMETLIQQSNTVTAIVPKSEEEHEWNAEKQIENLGVKLIRVSMERRGMNPVRDMKLFGDYLKVIRKIQPDMAITYTIKPNAYGGLACRWLHVPYAANITGLGTAFQKAGFLRFFVKILYRISLKKAQVVFFENEENYRTIVSNKIIHEDQGYILHGAGVDTERFNLQRYPEEDDIKFLFIGRVMREKGICELFDAMKRLHSENPLCTLDVVGDCEEDWRGLIDSGITEGWLRYHGYQTDVRPFIAESHCFVLPSWHEGMANTILECAASGRPVIASNIHGCLEAVIDGQSGYLCIAKNAESLFQALLRFSVLPKEERMKMGRSGREHMIKTFDKRKVVQETIRQLEKDRE